jgi:hypothetical protein
MSTQVDRAMHAALRLIGHTPDRYDVDAVLGSLMSAGVHVLLDEDVTEAMFGDRCDFECPICHPEDDT